MFISNLNLQERKAFAQLAWHLVHIDGVLSESETEVLDTIERETGFRGEAQKDDYIKLADVFGGREAKISVLLELLSLAHVDGNYDASEQQMIQNLSVHFKIENEELDTLHSWVIRQTMLLQEAQSFMEE